MTWDEQEQSIYANDCAGITTGIATFRHFLNKIFTIALNNLTSQKWLYLPLSNFLFWKLSQFAIQLVSIIPFTVDNK